MMKRYEYLLFDADNTLFDFTKAERISFRLVCDKCGVEYSDELQILYSNINDELWKKLETGSITLEFLKLERFRRLLTEYNCGENDDTASRAVKMRDTYIDTLAEQTCLVDGAEEICKVLCEKYKMYIVTNGISKIQRSRFSKSLLKPYFLDIFVSEEIGFAKPSGEYFDYVTEKIGENDKSKYLVIGDSLTSDCDGAISYGFDICRFNPKKLPNKGRALTYNISRLSELSEIL